MVAGVYLGTSLIWWFLLRTFKSVVSLSLPFLFYGLAFLLLGVSPFVSTYYGRGIIQDAATAVYAAAASSGALFFALNFGDEGGSDTQTWIFRACVIQGIAQIYIVALWYWGSVIEADAVAVQISGVFVGNSSIPKILVITVPIAVLMWAVGVILYIGLPDYYRQSPDKIPAFYRSLMNRRIVPMFFVAVIIQNYFLSAPYGRTWEFLFASKHIPSWSILILAFIFFVVVWCILFWAFAGVGKSHPWLLPLFAIGLGAPRWAQMLWATSGIGLYLPWTGSPVASALVSRILWLWLGLLDSIQGVGIGMILLTTLTRMHVAATLIGAQTLGSIATILAKATAPNRNGPGDVFPDFSEGLLPGIAKPWFWVAMVLQLVICLGFFKFFRKEQVSKP
jgi:alpha-1,3-glucan synthase